MAKKLYRVRFVNEDKIYEIYARHVYQGEMYGFITIEDIVFGEHSTIVVDTSEEKLRAEFEGVKQTHIPLHSIIRIDEVKKQGSAKILSMDDNKVANFPSSIYSPKGKSDK